MQISIIYVIMSRKDVNFVVKKSTKCISPDCRVCTSFQLDDLLIVPFEGGTPDTRKLFSYFLYSAPNIESTHSKKIPLDLHNEIFNRMIDKRHYKYQKFCGASAVIDKELEKGHLDGDSFCLKCKRFVCKKKQTTKGKLPESDLDCFLRHIRNSIAHGRVYFLHGGNKIHIVFEDENTTGNLSARIVCIKADLEHWKRVLSDKKYYCI